MSIRLRLTLLYSAILATTLLVFSGLLYTVQSRYTLDILEQDLAANTAGLTRMVVLAQLRLARGAERHPGDPRLQWRPPAGTEPDGSVWAAAVQGLRDLRIRDPVRIVDAEGTALDPFANEEGESLPLSEEGLQAVLDGQVQIEVAHLEGERWLTYSQPVIVEEQGIGIVQVARSLAERDRSLRSLGATLIGGSVLTTLVAFGIGWVVSAFALRPIQRITKVAQAIGEERDFGSRVVHQGPSDEVGHLARTFNTMLSRLQSAYQQVAHALAVQRDFVADVSHELRTPLTTIRGNLALLGHNPPIPSEEREDVLADLVDETERLTRLVNDLLVLARADAGRQLQCEPVPVRPVIEDLCRHGNLLAPGREIECSATGDLVAWADRDALKQVLLIFVDNAIKHTDGPVRFTTYEREGEIAIRVHDTGPGLSVELRERVFDRFCRGDASRSTPGFGLGLSVAKALAEAQHGRIEVETYEDEGSTFSVILPSAAL